MKLLLNALKDAANNDLEVNLTVKGQNLTISIEDDWLVIVLPVLALKDSEYTEIDIAKFIWSTIEKKKRQ